MLTKLKMCETPTVGSVLNQIPSLIWVLVWDRIHTTIYDRTRRLVGDQIRETLREGV